MLRLMSNCSSVEKVFVDNDADEELQEESSKGNQNDVQNGNQEEQHEDTNVEQDEGTFQSLPKRGGMFRFILKT